MFKELIHIDNINREIAEINDTIDAIEEFGYVVVASDSQQKIKDKSKIALSKIQEAKKILDELHSEMQDWYSY